MTSRPIVLAVLASYAVTAEVIFEGHSVGCIRQTIHDFLLVFHSNSLNSETGQFLGRKCFNTYPTFDAQIGNSNIVEILEMCWCQNQKTKLMAVISILFISYK